jgi:hypothetical protein
MFMSSTFLPCLAHPFNKNGILEGNIICSRLRMINRTELPVNLTQLRVIYADDEQSLPEMSD